MSTPCKHLSGGAKRKKKADIEIKVRKCPKIDSFFTTPSTNKPIGEVSLMKLEESNNDTIFTDKGNFKEPLTETQKRFIIDNDPCRPSEPFPQDKDNRGFSSFYYTEISNSGMKTQRWWLCYSPILNQCYCEPCWLFGRHNVVCGSTDWKHLSRNIEAHQNKAEHKNCCSIYNKWKFNQTINQDKENLIRKQKSFWHQVLQRVIDVTLTLAFMNISFRGSDESLTSPKHGAFMAVIKLLSKNDLVLKNLLENHTQKSVTYLSPQIQDEIINTLGDAVKSQIIHNITLAPFFALIINTTQDISKKDQISVILRYVVLENENDIIRRITIKESFLGFVTVEEHTEKSLADKIITEIRNNGLDLQYLCGQCYDGAANMSEVYNGVQAVISNLVPNAPLVHCADHSLNSVLNDSVKNVETIGNFYDLLEQIYVFFGHSIKHWHTLSSFTYNWKMIIKQLNPTSWSSRNDALMALVLVLMALTPCTIKKMYRVSRVFIAGL